MAGIVLDARVPIILTSRADSLLTRLASCAAWVKLVNVRVTPGKPGLVVLKATLFPKMVVRISAGRVTHVHASAQVHPFAVVLGKLQPAVARVGGNR